MNQSQHEKCLSFFAIIHADVTNYLHREIFADWLDDQGMDKEALGQRWLARNKREIGAAGWWTTASNLVFHRRKCTLPDLFTEGGKPRDEQTGTDIIGPCDLEEAELAFMKRCTELVWNESGEPISELQLEGVEK